MLKTRPFRRVTTPGLRLHAPRRQTILTPYPSSGLVQERHNAPMIQVDAAKFNGTTSLLNRAGGFTGAVDGKTGIFSVWYRIDGGDNLNQIFLVEIGGGGNQLQLSRDTTNFMHISAGVALNSGGRSTFLAGPAWLHVLMSWDMNYFPSNSGPAVSYGLHMYVNDAIDKPISQNSGAFSYTSGATIDYTPTTNWQISTNGGTPIVGALAEFYFAPNQFLDFSYAENRRKFRSETGKPVSLGLDGSRPTGVAPLIYNHLDKGETPTNFALNRAGNGDWTASGGALLTATTSPSD